MRRFLQQLRKGLHKVLLRLVGLWRWSRCEHAAQARLARPSRWTGRMTIYWDLSFISKC
jgi:hypothetical protein